MSRKLDFWILGSMARHTAPMTLASCGAGRIACLDPAGFGAGRKNRKATRGDVFLLLKYAEIEEEEELQGTSLPYPWSAIDISLSCNSTLASLV